MIRYALKCAKDHSFESWFASASAFGALIAAGHVTCPDCGTSEVRKSLMAPRVRPGRAAAKPGPEADPAPAPAPDAPALNAPATEMEARLKALRQHVEATSDYVGLSFATEARKMHDGEIPHRPIYGEARPDEAKKLIEDGVPVAPLPFRPSRKTN